MWRKYLAVMIYFAVNALCSALKNIAKKALFIEKRLFHGQGRLSPKNREPLSTTRRAVFLYPASRQEKTKKATACQRLPESCSAPSGRAKPRFSLLFRERPVSFERRRLRKEKTAPLRGQPKIRMIARYFLSAPPSLEARLRRRRIFLPTCALRDRRK